MSSADLFLPKPTLTGQLVELRPFDLAAIDSMIEVLSDPQVLAKTGSFTSDSEATSNSVSEGHLRSWYSSRNSQTDRLDLAIFDLTHQMYVGEAVLNRYDSHNRSANYRIAIGARGQGRGLGTETTQLMIDYGFSHLNLNRIELEVFEFNTRARYVYSSCGFVTEGRRREALYYNGQFHDSLIKSIIRSDWEVAQTKNSLSADLHLEVPLVPHTS